MRILEGTLTRVTLPFRRLSSRLCVQSIKSTGKMAKPAIYRVQSSLAERLELLFRLKKHVQ